MSHFFVCYDPQDLHFAHAVRATVDRAGFSTWMDTTKIRRNCWWTQDVDQAIKESFGLLVIMTPEAAANTCATYEWGFALGAGVPVLPLMFKQMTLPAPLAVHHVFDFTEPQEYPWESLKQLLQEMIRTRVGYAIQHSPAKTAKAEPLPSEEPSVPAEVTPTKERDMKERVSSTTDLADQTDNTAVRDTLTESLEHPMRDVRVQASLMLAQYKEPRAVPVLIDALHDRGRDVHQHASWGLLHIGTPAVPHLIEAMQDKDNYVRRDVAKILGQIGDTSAIPCLVEALQDESGEVRRAVAEALGHCRSSEAVPALSEALQDEQEVVRRAVAESLGHIGNASAVPGLIQALKDENEGVRVVAAWSLGQIRDSAVVPALIEALREKNQLVRQAVADVLKEIGDPSVEPALNEALRDKDVELRRTAARILGHIRSRYRFTS